MGSKKKEVYISVDIETGGPYSFDYSLLSLGACVVVDAKLTGEEFSVNLEELPGTNIHPDTKREFWDKNPEAWDACRKDLVSPEIGMKQFDNWLSEVEKKYNGKLVFCAYPAGFDFSFVYPYLMKFVGHSRFSFSALDMKTLAMAILKCDFRNVGKRTMPKDWFDPNQNHSHISLEDAREQGFLLCSMLESLSTETVSLVK